MASRLQQRRARLRAEYGFDFPDDFYRFWEFVNRLAPLDPINALQDLGITLVGPFDVLAGRFDGRVPQHSLLLHWRYYQDPPEFFTVLAGDTDRLHWGYWLDDPGQPGAAVAHYYASDGLALEADGDDLFAAVRLHLEYLHADNETYRDEDPESGDKYDERLAQLARHRERLSPFTDRAEVGESYTSAYRGRVARQGRVVARTLGGIGIVVPPQAYRPLSLSDKQLWARLRRTKSPRALAEEARLALREGYPGTALKVGQDLWGLPGPARAALAVELLDDAYAALDRETPRRVLQTHVANRDLPFVDILHEESEGSELDDAD